MMELIQFNLRRIPYFKAWGIFAFMGDMTILIASEPFPSSDICCADDSDVLLVQSQGQYASSSTKIAGETTDDRPRDHVRSNVMFVLMIGSHLC
jgi:hypothetical protein